nr:MAG TPA: hypothetical protein [Caudoviricetes sp.]
MHPRSFLKNPLISLIFSFFINSSNQTKWNEYIPILHPWFV